MFDKVAVSIKLRVTEDDQNTVALLLQQKKKSFSIRCLLEVSFLYFRLPFHALNIEMVSVALFVEESDFFNFALSLADTGALYVRKIIISTLTNNYKEFFFLYNLLPNSNSRFLFCRLVTRAANSNSKNSEILAELELELKKSL